MRQARTRGVSIWWWSMSPRRRSGPTAYYSTGSLLCFSLSYKHGPTYPATLNQLFLQLSEAERKAVHWGEKERKCVFVCLCVCERDASGIVNTSSNQLCGGRPSLTSHSTAHLRFLCFSLLAPQLILFFVYMKRTCIPCIFLA